MLTFRKRGNSYQAIVRVKRQGVIVFQEARSFPKERLAKDWGVRREKEVTAEGGIAQAARKRTTLGQLLLDHLDKLEAAGPVRRTRAGELAQLAEEFGKVPLQDMEPALFVKFAESRRKAGVSPSTVLHNLATVRAVLGTAKALHGIEVDGRVVADAIKVLNVTKVTSRSESRERRATQEELDALVAEFQRVASHPSTVIPMHVIVPLAVALPRRRGELVEALWDDLDKTKRLLKLRDTKHPSKPRVETVPVPPEAMALIERLPRLDARILPYKEESISASFQRACARLGIADLRFHDLRHEGITRLFEAGHSIQEVALVSGHLSWGMLRRYTHLEAENLARKMHKDQPHAGEQEAPKTTVQSP